MDRKAGVVVIEKRQHCANLLSIEQLRVDAVEPHGIAAAGEGVALRVGVIEIEDAALADHDIVIELALQPFPQLHRPFIELDVRRQQVIGADDGRVAAGIARADPAFLQNGDVVEAVFFGEIIGRRQTVTAAADNDHVIFGLWLRVAPHWLPVGVAAQRLVGQRKSGIFHWRFRLVA